MKIQKLTLHSSNLEQQRRFYSDVLGFQELKCTDQTLHYQVGETELIFDKRDTTTPYHFAFNIPSNKIDEALLWLKMRTEILKDGEDEIQDFESWFAKAVYCYDADKNIIEFIARKNIDTISNDPFSPTSILSVSEIGIVSENNVRVQIFLESNCQLPIFKGVKEVFSAIGDDHGLFICMDKTKRKWYPTSEEAFCSAFDAEIIEKGEHISIRYEHQELQIL